jgi:recombination protein RecA
MFGNPETTTGGLALKFYASVRLDVRRIEQLKDGDKVIGNRARVKVVKNKMSPPFRIAEFDVMSGEGISKIGGLLDVGIETGIISKSGAFLRYGEQMLGQGRENAKEFLRENKDLAEKIKKEIMVKTQDGKPLLEVGVEEEEDRDTERELAAD